MNFLLGSSTGEILPVSRRVPSVMCMVVDHGHDFERFKIFVMRCAQNDRRQTSSIIVYNSTTSSSHRCSTNLVRLTGISPTILVRCIAFFHGFLYALNSFPNKLGDRFWQLWSYNPDEDAWNDTSVKNCPPTFLLHPQRVVSDNRLFLVSWKKIIPENHLPLKTFDLVEIWPDSQEETCETLFHMSEALMERLLETGFSEETPAVTQLATTNGYCFEHSPDVAAFGFEKSIILMCRKSGISQEYDVVTCSSLERPFEAFPCEEAVWYGQPMHLSLHPRLFSSLP